MVVHVLFERRMESWRLAAATPSSQWALAYVAGEMPAILDVDALPASREVLPFTESLIHWLEVGQAPAAPPAGAAEMVEMWREFTKPEPGSTFVEKTLWLERFRRSAVRFITESPTKGRNQFWVVVDATPNGWEMVWAGHDFGPGPLLAKLG